MKLKDVFEKSVQFFKEKKIETARIDAEIIISFALNIERLQIYLKYEQPLSEIEIQNCRELVKRRGQGEPVAYIVKEKGFYGEIFSVGPGVLIPRPETEQIVEEALVFIKANHLENPQILDLGAGTGCIGFSILKNSNSAKLVSIEKSEAAFVYLKENQNRLGLSERSELIFQDVLAADFENKKFDIIVANPPYISEDDLQIETEVKKFEPAEALFAKQEGYQAILDWTSKFSKYLKPTGLLLIEMGHNQGAKLKAHCEALLQFSEVRVLKDLSGFDRVVKCAQQAHVSK